MVNEAAGVQESVSKKRGRPRDPAVDEAVYRATVEALSTDGFGRISISDIAKKSGVARPTIYLRWGSLHDLVVDALDWYAGELSAPEPQGDELVDALRSALNMMVPEGRRDLGLGLVGHVIADARQHPELLGIIKTKMIEPYRQAIMDVLKCYMDEGIIRNDLTPEVLVDFMMGNFFSVFLNTGEVGVDSVERMVDAIWPLISEKKRSRAPTRESLAH